MSEKDLLGNVDGQRVPPQSQTKKPTSLHDILTATAAKSAERARIVLGNSTPRREVGYLQDLIKFAREVLPRKWGIFPTEITGAPITVFQAPAIVINVKKPPDTEITPDNLQELLELPLYQGLFTIRKATGISQQVLADKMETTKGSIDKWERGLKIADVALVHDYCDALGLGPDDIRREILVNKAIEDERARRKATQEKFKEIRSKRTD